MVAPAAAAAAAEAQPRPIRIRRRCGSLLFALLAAASAAFGARETPQFVVGMGKHAARCRSLSPVVAMAAAAPSASEVIPLGNQVLVELLEVEEVTKGGLILAESAKNKQQKLRMGHVRALGQGKLGDLRDPRLLEALKEGDVVIWEDFANRPLSEDADNKMFLVPARSIKAKVKST
ncbi:unnamed protein product [Polarella glacialis]|uniref:Uncharacterized protein n=2 Tax=Polarella glacialis TaxID=89957 RepID=A0A813FQH5_POLGL|nr:unnamed protein product [Polarella glacialis]